MYGVICKACDSRFEVNEGSGMIAMPLHCDRCGKEWWWEFGSWGPSSEPNAPACQCGGRFTEDSPARCPQCGSTALKRDADGYQILHD